MYVWNVFVSLLREQGVYKCGVRFVSQAKRRKIFSNGRLAEQCEDRSHPKTPYT